MEAIPIMGFGAFKDLILGSKSLGLRVALWTLDDELFYHEGNLDRLAGLYDIIITNDVDRMIAYLRSGVIK